MKRNTKLAAVLGLITIMTASVLTGCGDGKGTNEQGSEITNESVSGGPTAATDKSDGNTNAVQSSDGDKEQVTLRFTWWGGDDRNEATLQVIDMFEKKYPWITIEGEFSGSDGYQEKLSTSLAGKTAADIIQNGPGWMPGFVEKGDFFVDFNEYKGDIDLTGFDEAFLDNAGTFDGKLLGLPSGIANPAMVVNKTLADKIGISFTDDMTWNDLLDMGKKVQEYDDNLYLLNIDESYMITNIFRPYIMQLTGKPFIDNDTKTMSCSQEQLMQTLSYIKELYDNHVIQPASDSTAFEGAIQTNPKWIAGEFVAAACVSSTIDVMISANENAEYISAGYPHLDDSKNDGYYSNPPQLMCIYKNSEHVDEAVMFLDYFFNDPQAAAVLKDTRSVPATSTAREVCEKEGYISEQVLSNVEWGRSQKGSNEMGLTTDSEIEAVIKTMLEGIMFAQDSVESNVKNGMSMIENILIDK